MEKTVIIIIITYCPRSTHDSTGIELFFINYYFFDELIGES